MIDQVEAWRPSKAWPSMDSEQSARLRKLLAKSRRLQWILDDGIDWGLPIRPSKWIPKSVTQNTVSQLYHGEQASAAMCRHLQEHSTSSEVSGFLELQLSEEERHARAYCRYLNEIGGITEANAALNMTFTAGYNAPGGFAGKVIACHIMLESEALAIHEVLAERIRCPLLTAINKRIGPDEARHVAFGRLLAKEMVAELSPRTKQQLIKWAQQTWSDCAQKILDDMGGFSALAMRPLRNRLTNGWRRHTRALADIGLIDTRLS